MGLSFDSINAGIARGSIVSGKTRVETIGGGGRVIRAVGTLLEGASHGIVSCGKRARNRNCGHASVGQRGSRPAPRVGPGTVPAWGNGQGMKMNAHVPFPNK